MGKAGKEAPGVPSPWWSTHQHHHHHHWAWVVLRDLLARDVVAKLEPNWSPNPSLAVMGKIKTAPTPHA